MAGSIVSTPPSRYLNASPSKRPPTRYLVPTRGGRPPGKGKKPGKKPAAKDSKDETRGHDVSVQEGAAPWNVIYGRVRLGGTQTFTDTGHQDASKSHLTTGTEDAQIAWTAKTSGADGNDISITIVVPTSQANSVVSVVGTDITITAKSSGGHSQATANSIITLINGDPDASALVRTSKGDGKGTSNVAAQAKTNMTGGGGTWLHTVHTLACHEINSLDYVYLDDEVLTFGGTPDPRWAIGRFKDVAFVSYNRGTADQVALPDLVAQLPDKWTADHKQSGRAHAYLATIFKNSVFPNGMPDIAFQVSGRKVYDPRDGAQVAGDESTYVFSTNAALCAADFLTNTVFGYKVPWSRINLVSLAEAANICDELIPLKDGSFELRYTVNGTYDVSLGRGEVLREIEKAMAGNACRINGKWNFFPGAYRAPTITLTRDNAVGPITVITKNRRRELYNGAKGTFVDAKNKFEKTDFPAVKNSTYLTQDGGVENYADLNFAFVTSGATAQRLARIEMEKSRQGIRVTFPGDMSCLRLHPNCPVYLQDEDLGFEPKEFIVEDIQIEVTSSGDEPPSHACVLTLAETGAGIHNWDPSYETTVDVAPNSSLKSPFDVTALIGVTLSSGTADLYQKGDSTIASRLKVSWTEPSDYLVTEGGYYEVQFKRSADSESSYQNINNVPGGNNFTYIIDVQDAQLYDVRVRAVNGIGAFSEWRYQTLHLVQGKSVKPSDVTGFGAEIDSFGITLFCQAISDLDFKEFEVRRGTDWDTAIFEQRFNGTRIKLPIRTSGSYSFLIKARDTSLNESEHATPLTFSLPAPDAPAVGIASFDRGDAILRWGIPNSYFALDTFLIYQGATFDTAVPLGEAKVSTFKVRAAWSGTQRFWIVARDVAGNTSSALMIEVVVVAPGQVSSFRPEVVDNNVNFFWTAPASGTLPIEHYNLYKGDVFADADLIGEAPGTFKTKFEYLAGTYTYWIVAVDLAGNHGPPRSLTTLVNQPPDFELQADVVLNPLDATTIYGVLVDGEAYFAIPDVGTPIGLTLVFTRS